MFLKRIRSVCGSLRFRFTVLYLTLLAFTLVIFCAILFHYFVKNHQNEFDIALYNYTLDVAETISVEEFGVYQNRSLINTDKKFPFLLGRAFIQVVSVSGKIEGTSPNLGSRQLPIFSEDWQELIQNGFSFRSLLPNLMRDIPNAQPGTTYRQITYLVKRGSSPFILQIAVPMTLILQETASLVMFFIFGIPITLVLAAAGGLFLSHKALEPVRDVMKKAKELNPYNLSERLPEPGGDDEINRLTVTLNELLGRIEKAFQSYENFIADASHQLKTPLAILRGELDVFRNKNRPPEEVEGFFNSAGNELLHMSRLLDDLLILAKMDAGAGSLTMRKVRLDEILMETASRIQILAKKKNISIRLNLEDKTEGKSSKDFEILGDSDLLQSMFRNLIDNAIKYSPENSTVEVIVTNFEKTVFVGIKDLGDHIPPEVATKLFRRYERGEIRLPGISGTGLGLMIARKIAELHGGNILILQDNSPGKTFQVEMKKN